MGYRDNYISYNGEEAHNNTLTLWLEHFLKYSFLFLQQTLQLVQKNTQLLMSLNWLKWGC